MARLDAALAIAKLGTFDWNVRTNQVLLDQRSREMLGFPPHEPVTARDIFERIDPRDLDRVSTEVQAAREQQASLETEYRIKHPDGTIRTLISISNAVMGTDGGLERMIGVFNDVTERRRVEALLRAERDRSRGILDSMGEGFVLVGPDFQVLDINGAALRIENRPRGEIVGRSFWEAWPGSEEAELGRLCKQVMTERVPGRLVHEYVWPDGHRAWLELRVYPSQDGLALFMRDVTQQKQAQAANAHLAALVAASGDAIMSFAPDGTILSWNAAAEQVFGHTAEEAIGQKVSILVPEDHAHEPNQFFARVRAGEVVTFESVRRRKDGSLFEAALSLSPMQSSEGEVIGVSAIARDMTDRNQREKSLRDSQRRLNAVLNNATVAIFLMDDRQHCVYMNAAAERLTGYTLPETLGRPLHEVIHHTRPDGSHFPLEECAIDRAFPEEHQTQGEEVFVHKDGSFYPVAFTASPIQDEGSRPIGTIIEVRDIRAEKQAQVDQRVLINELNHRVKNTLATVQSIAAQTLRNASSTQEAKGALEGRLFALSRTHDVLTRESWDGADLYDIAAQAVEPYSNRSEDRLHLTGPHVRLPPRMALALAMAFQELATNAVKYGALSMAGGEIRITWEVDPADARTELHLCWEERGGPPVEAPARRGFGTRLIERSLAQDLGGDVRIEFAPTGVVCTVAAPLNGS
ncbi:PAS domain-containing sensor histidine kinase [Microvirga subterranea]|nr:PAS domain S-box protein [Microvirga subterranea]